MNSSVDSCQNGLLSLDDALGRILGSLSPLEATEQVTLNQPTGRIVAETITAPFDLPPFTNSAMDGYALFSEGLRPGMGLSVIGKSMAGQPFEGSVKKGECVRIFTGAPLPEGADSVIMQEETLVTGNRLTLKRLPSKGENIRPAGGDVRKGEQLFTRGKRLNAADVGLLASLGHASITVYQRPRVGFFSTGDELRSLGKPLTPGAIYESNRYQLQSLLTALPVESTDLGQVPDRLEPLLQRLHEASRNHDVILSTGGASVGEADLLEKALKRLGRLYLWKVAIKPGKPLLFGRLGEAWFFGLPGNPVSVHVTFSQIVRPALWKLAGASSFKPLRIQARCTHDLHKTPGRLEFQRGIVRVGENGEATVSGLAGQGSHQLKSLSQANCYIILPPESKGAKSGETVLVEPFTCLLTNDD